MKYRNPETGETRLLGGSKVNAKARALEAAGWERVYPLPTQESKKPGRKRNRKTEPSLEVEEGGKAS